MVASDNERVQRTVQEARQIVAKEGYDRCFYTLWGREAESALWEEVPQKDLFGTALEETGRQDWRKLRPFDFLPDLDPKTGGHESKLLMVGESARIGCEAIAGTQPYFERAGDFQTIFLQFSGNAVVETSYGSYELQPGEAMLIPAMVAHRTTGSPNCRRMVFQAKEPLESILPPDLAITDIRYTVHRVGDPEVEERVPEPAVPSDGKVLERLTMWEGRPGEEFIFRRTHEAIVGSAETGQAPAKVRPFDYYTTPPEGPNAGAVRTSLLWGSDSFKQRTYANPARQPGTHRGYDEDEHWFEFAGHVLQESEHGTYDMEGGECSMAEAGISHNSAQVPGSLRFVTYTSKPIRMVVDPADQLRHSKWEVRRDMVRAWPEVYEGPPIPGSRNGGDDAPLRLPRWAR